MATGAIVTDVVKDAASKLFDGAATMAKEHTGYVRSIKGLLNQTPIGKDFAEFLEKKFEPTAKQIGQQKLDLYTAKGSPYSTKEAVSKSAKEAYQETREAAFGKNDEGLIKFIHSATKKHGQIYGNNVADAMSVYLHDSSSYWRKAQVSSTLTKTAGKTSTLGSVGIRPMSNYKPPTEGEQKFRSVMSTLMTPLIAIPHLSQVANVFLDNSLKDVYKGVGEMIAGGGTKEAFHSNLLKSGVMFDELRYQMLEDANGGGWARKLFHHPGFNAVRRFELTLAAATGKHAALDAVDKLAGDAADRKAGLNTLAKLGIDPAKIQGNKLTEEQIQKAMYREADRTIFIRSPLHTPWKWDESQVARYAFMYKHFMYRQGGFINSAFREMYKAEGLKGVAKGAAVFSVVFPVFGELVKSLENAVLLQNPLKRDTKDAEHEYVDAIGNAAGFGMYYSMNRAAQHYQGRGFFEGPVLSTADDFVIGIPDSLRKGKTHKALKTAIQKMGWPGRIAAKHISPDKSN